MTRSRPSNLYGWPRLVPGPGWLVGLFLTLLIISLYALIVIPDALSKTVPIWCAVNQALGFFWTPRQKISNFCPPQERDFSFKFINPLKFDILDRIFEIYAMDLFSSDEEQGRQRLKTIASATNQTPSAQR